MNQSVTITGLLVIVLSLVFEPKEAQTLIDSAIVIIDQAGIVLGILGTYYGRYRQGDITWYGTKK